MSKPLRLLALALLVVTALANASCSYCECPPGDSGYDAGGAE